MKYETQTIKELLKEDSNKKLVLPDFQREFVWQEPKQSRLLASILVDIPIGAILIVEGEGGKFLSRQLGFTEHIHDIREECRYLLDGQQRLSCIKSFFINLLPDDNWQENFQSLFGKLRKRWFIKIFPENSDLDIWGYKNLNFDGNLKQYDPSEVEDFIASYNIEDIKTTIKKFYHPAFSPEDPNCPPNHRKELLARKYAENLIVPLFDIYNNPNENSLHWQTIQEIAKKRQRQIQYDFDEKKVALNELFTEKQINILEQEKNEDKKRNKVREWLQDRTYNWIHKIGNTLNSILNERYINETVLPSEEIDRAVAIFETMNQGGTPLSTFDLIVAKAARHLKDDRSLSNKIKDYIKDEIEIPSSLHENKGPWTLYNMNAIEQKSNSLNKSFTDQFLNLISIINHEHKQENIKVEYMKRRYILQLEPDQIINSYQRAVESLRKCFAFLQYRCGIIKIQDLHYELMILPIAYLFFKEEEQKQEIPIWNDEVALNKIEYWYWISLFSGQYKDNQNQQCISDLQFLYKWVFENQSNPFRNLYKLVLNKEDFSDEKTLMHENQDENGERKTSPEAMKKSILQYILSQQPKDFIISSQPSTGNDIPKLKTWEIADSEHQYKLEQHHIIPIKNDKKRNDKKHILNSPLNLTYISDKANQNIGDSDPKDYLDNLSSVTLKAHGISPHVIKNVLNDLKTANSQYEKLEVIKQLLQDRFNSLKRKLETELEQLLDVD